MQKKGFISSPGRVCLFGEHQDYLGLPVVPMAINKRLTLHYELQERPRCVQMQSNQMEHSEELLYTHPPQLTSSSYDYQKAVFLYFWQELNRILPSSISINSDIPIRSGLSSSAALLTAMVFLISNVLLERNFNAETIAEIAYLCEHDILNISCGRMDQYTCSLGRIFHMSSQGKPDITPLCNLKEAYFIIGNSGVERKADIPLKNVQQDIFKALNNLRKPNLNELTDEEINSSKLSQLQRKRLLGVIGVRDNTQIAFEELKKATIDLDYIGQLLTEQQTFLRENYQVSHPKLDVMCESALKNGALGSKLTGAGFGGCMFAFTADNKKAVKIREVLQTHGDSFITRIDSGVSKH